MIGQISPLVQGGTAWWKLAVAHMGGGVSGGLVVGLFAGLLSILFASSPVVNNMRAAVLPVGAVGLAMLETGLLPVRRVSPSRQTQRGWACALGPTWAAAAWGADLGLMVTTRITLQTALLVPVFALISGSLVASCLIPASYGLARAGAVVIVARRPDRSAASCEYLNARGSYLRWVASATAVALAAFVALIYTS